MSSANQFPAFPVALASHEDIVKDATLFMETLQCFHFSLGTKFTIPVISRKELNLHFLYVEVTKRGGFEQVVREKRWKEVSKAFEFAATITNASHVLKKHYLSLLHRYEVVYFRLGSVAPVLPQIDPVQVEGVIDSQFEHGCLVSAKLNNKTLSGVLYYDTASVGSSSFVAEPQPCTSVVPYAALNLNQPADNVVPQPTAPKGKTARTQEVEPGYPKHSRSGYNYFFAEKHAALSALYSNRQSELTRFIARSWNNLPAEQKMVYQGYGERDRERYEKEMEEYTERLNMGQQG